MVISMKRKRMTIYNTEDVFTSKSYEPGRSFEAGSHTHNGYSLEMEDGSQIICQPSLAKRVKVEEIEA